MLSRQGDRCGRDKTGATPRFFPAVRDSIRAPDGTVKTPRWRARLSGSPSRPAPVWFQRPLPNEPFYNVLVEGDEVFVEK